MISAVTSLGAVIQMVQQKASWPAKSDAFHRHREALQGLILKAEYETMAADDAAIANLSKEFRQERDQIAETLQRIDSPNETTEKK